jgi:hypothetical protein
VPKTVKVDFWDVIGQDDKPFDLLPIIENVSKLPFQKRMRDRAAGQKDYLAEVFPGPAAASGTVALIRAEDWPSSFDNQTGELDALLLAANQDLAEEMSFLFDRDLRTLATQRNRQFRATRLAAFLCELSGAKFFIQPKLREDAWSRFQRMTRIGKVELKVFGPLHHPEFSRSIPPMAGLLNESQNSVNALEVGIILSVGRQKKRTLDLGIVRRIVDFFRQGEETAASLTVSGNAGDDNAETVDFIHDRLIFAGRVDYTEKHLDRAKCRQLLTEAIQTHRAYLAGLL